MADGDELNIYGTDPTVFDSDGDGVSDGEELFGIFTDPLVWNDFSVACWRGRGGHRLTPTQAGWRAATEGSAEDWWRCLVSATPSPRWTNSSSAS